VPHKRLLYGKIDEIEAEIERELGHWSTHIGYDPLSMAPAQNYPIYSPVNQSPKADLALLHPTFG